MSLVMSLFPEGSSIITLLFLLLSLLTRLTRIGVSSPSSSKNPFAKAAAVFITLPSSDVLILRSWRNVLRSVAMPNRRARGGGRQRVGGCTHVMMHGRSRMTIDPRIPTRPGRSTSCFHRPGRGVYPIHPARHVKVSSSEFRLYFDGGFLGAPQNVHPTRMRPIRKPIEVSNHLEP